MSEYVSVWVYNPNFRGIVGYGSLHINGQHVLLDGERIEYLNRMRNAGVLRPVPGGAVIYDSVAQRHASPWHNATI